MTAESSDNKLNRRTFLSFMALAGMGPWQAVLASHKGIWVNDAHSGLNRTLVSEIQQPDSLSGLKAIVKKARELFELSMLTWSHLIDRAIEVDGSFYLTYQHVANKNQILACYPNFQTFLALKRKYDPNEIFQSDWYRWHRRMFA